MRGKVGDRKVGDDGVPDPVPVAGLGEQLPVMAALARGNLVPDDAQGERDPSVVGSP